MKTAIVKIFLAVTSAAAVNTVIFYSLSMINTTAPRESSARSKIRLWVPPRSKDRPRETIPPELTEPASQEVIMTVDLDMDYEPMRPKPLVSKLKPGVSGIELSPLQVHETKTLEAEQVDQPPRELTNPHPKYPKLPRKRGIQGSVTVKLLIDQLGRVKEVVVLSVDGHQSFRDAVLEVAPSWRFEPARHRGEPVMVWGIKTVSFKLKEADR